MSEVRVISRRPISFACYVMVSLGPVLLQFFDPFRDKSVANIPSGSWILLSVGLLTTAAVTIKAWLSDASSKARNEIESSK